MWIRRNDISTERFACRGIVDDDRLLEKGIRRVEQFAQVAVAHGEAGDRPRHRLAFAALDPFFGPEEKQLRVFALCDLRDKNGPADIPTVLIEAERRRTKILRGERAMIARPVV